MAELFLVPKLLYVCLYILYGSAIAYLPIYYSEVLQLSSNQIGFILAIAPFIQVVACPLWTLIADKHPSWHGPLMAILTAIGGGSVLLLLLIPDYLMTSNTNTPADSTNSAVMFATSALALVFAFFASPVCALVDGAVLKILGDQKLLYGNQRLWGSVSNGINIFAVGFLITLLGIQVSFGVFAFGVVSLVILFLFLRFEDAPCMAEEEDERQPLLLSKSETAVRGHYAYMPSELVSQSSSRHSIETNSHEPPPFFHHDPRRAVMRRGSMTSHANTDYLEENDDRRLNLLLTTSTSIAAMDTHVEAEEALSNLVSMPSVGLALSRIPTVDTSLAAFAAAGQPGNELPSTSSLHSTPVRTFLLMTLLFGMSFSMVSQFIFLILHRDLGMEASLIGWTGPLGGAAETVTYWISKELFGRFSVTALTIVAHLLFILRSVVFTFLVPDDTVSAAIALGLHLVNGFSYALIWSISVAEVDTFFPIEQRAVAQGVLAALFNGMGYGLGCIVGGVVLEIYGPDMLFAVSACIGALSLVVFLYGRLSL